jgi:hypothetical protein
MKLILTAFFSFTIVVVACLANGCICALWAAAFGADSMQPGEVLGLALFFSGLFALPGILLFWLLFYVWAINGKWGQLLFRALASAAMGIAFCATGLFALLLHKGLPLPVPVVLLSATLSAALSIFLHRAAILAHFQPAKNVTHV